MTVGDCFAGIGGFSLGLERAGFDIAWQIEIDPFCRKVLEKHWPDVQRFGDIREANPPEVDVICGGFPCQDISVAGNGAGISGERSGLWREMLRLVRSIRPAYVVVENVSALTFRGLDVVLGDLSIIGYDAEWETLSACMFGAPHTRERLFIVAYPEHRGVAVRRRAQHSREGGEQLRRVPPTFAPRSGEQARQILETVAGAQVEWVQREPGISRVAHGIPNRIHRTRGLGNAIVPACAEYVARCVMEHSKS